MNQLELALALHRQSGIPQGERNRSMEHSGESKDKPTIWSQLTFFKDANIIWKKEFFVIK